jgi:hypothetical protein
MIDIDTLRELVAYDPETGALTWLPRKAEHFARPRDCQGWNTKYAGRPAFRTQWPSGYLAGHIFKQTALAHRVAWALHTNSWPDLYIDHVDGDRSNNRADNLRVVTAEDNQKNVKQRIDNTSGVKGVDFKAATGLWRARIVHQGRRITLGTYASLADAVAARKLAERDCGYHPNHGARG